MELKEGYKKTDIGVIPIDWDCVQLGNIGESIIGLTYKPTDVKKYGTLVLRSSNIDENKLVFLDNVFVNMSINEKLIVQENDILICVRNGSRNLIGKCALINKKTSGQTFGAFMSVFRSPYGRYVFNCFQSNIIKKQINDNMGATINQITNKNLNSFYIPLPRTDTEKDKIAKALSDIDALIISLTKLIDKKKNIKQGAMQELLTGKKRLEGFSGDWVKVNIGSIGKLTGSGVDKKIIEGQKPVTLLNYLDVYHRVFIYRKHLNHTVTATDEQRNKCVVLKGDIFFTPTSETPDDIAKSAVAMEDMNDVAYSYHVLRLRPYEGFSSYYLNYAFMTQEFINQTTTFSEGSGTRYIITLKKFKDLTITIPESKEEQTAISDILSDMATEIEKLDYKLNKYRSIKQGMMQELLTGRIRLIEEGIQ